MSEPRKRYKECTTDDEMLEFLRATLKEVDPDFEADTEPDAYQTAIVLLAALAEGPDVERLTKLTSYPRDFVSLISFRAEATGLWSAEGVHYEHWFEGEALRNVAFWSDVLVAEGLLARRRRDDGEFVYSAIRPS